MSLIVLVALLAGSSMLGSSPSFRTLSAGAGTPGVLGHPTPAAHPTVAVRPSVTHGDLVVGPANSPYVISPLTTGSGSYAQAGNITVQAGGSLIVKNTTLTFYEFVGNSGNLAQRLAHLNFFAIKGTATFVNSTLTTDARSINAYAKLSVNVSGGGQLRLVGSSFAFPGWVNVYGAGSFLQLNQSNLTRNTAVVGLLENNTILHDTLYAPALSVSGGARAMLGQSAMQYAYKDNVSKWLAPGPAPVTSNGLHQLSSAGGSTWTSWTTLTDSENLSKAFLYPRVVSGFIGLTYSTQVNQDIASGSSLTITSAAGLPAIHFEQGSGVVQVPLPGAAINQINSVGVAGYLNASGDFGPAATDVVTLGATNQAIALNITQVALNLSVGLQYNTVVSGSGSVLTAADSSLNLNWNLTPGSVVPAGFSPAPFPWASNKLALSNAAAAYLANVTITNGRAGVFWNSSAVQTDASSTANFYRWLEVPVTGVANSPIEGAKVTAFYSYDQNQANNATANALNNLAAADPDLNAYVLAGVARAGLSGYGFTGSAGQSWLLLTSTTLTASTAPDGQFLGGYHLGVSLPGGGAGANRWAYATVTPYPLGMTPAFTDVSPGVNYGTYSASLAFTGATGLSVNNVSVSKVTVAIGQRLSVSATVTNTGTGPSPTYTANFTYVNPFGSPASTTLGPVQHFAILAAGQSRTLTANWTVNQSTVGLHGWINTTFDLSVLWNGGVAPAGGVIVQTINATVAPSYVSVYLNPPGGTYSLQGEYPSNGTIRYNGSGESTVTVNAIGPSGTFAVGLAHVPTPGPYTLTIFPDPRMGPGTYSLEVNASFNGRTTHVVLTNWFQVGGTVPAPTPWFEQKYFGFALWLLLAIAAAIAVGAVGGFLVLSRRAAAGKLVECGECGELIPEDATVCPKCGAEFETGLVRCSRCNSTIPADSKVCPECSAQLLGKPEEASHDPERQGYADFVERYRAESKKELQDNYSEGAFWDWWKRQPTYVAFSQWRLQQAQGSRAGMSAPIESEMAPTPAPVARPAARPAAAAMPARAAAAPPARRVAAAMPAAPPAAAPPAAAPAQADSEGGSAGAGLKACSNCGKEIPSDYLVCPFCGAVTR